MSIIIPAYKRPSYTEQCLNSIQEAQSYDGVHFYFYDDGENSEVFKKYARPCDTIITNSRQMGLRNIIIDYFNRMKNSEYEYLCKVDNDCLVPVNWLDDLVGILDGTSVDILSPNVSESNAAFKYGKEDTYELGYRPSNVVGGLWNMRKKFIDNLTFDEADTRGIKGAFELLHEIIVLNDPRPKLGWTDKVTFQDIGYWKGSHPNHIKSEEHKQYSIEVGRDTSWNVEAGR